MASRRLLPHAVARRGGALRTIAVLGAVAAAAALAPSSHAAPPDGDVPAASRPAEPARSDAPGDAPEEATAPPVVAPADPYDRGTPRGAIEGFLEAANDEEWARAAEFLDLQRIPRRERDERGPDLARRLKAVLDRKLWVSVDELSGDPAGTAADGLPASRDLVGRIDTPAGPVDVALERVRRDDGVRIWKISAATLEQVPALYRALGEPPFADLLPPVLFRAPVLGVQLWQWIALAGAALLAFALSWLVVAITRRVLAPLARRSATRLDDRLLEIAPGPARLALWVLLLVPAERAIGLSVPVARTLAGLEQVLVMVAVTWLALRLVDVGAEGALERFGRRGRIAALPLVAPARKAAKAVVVVLAALVALDNLGFEVAAVLAGLGVGGIAVALAAQKTIENLFGGVTLFADQPVRVGDFCRFGDRVDTVEQIGLRSTRVRTLDRTVVTIPNGQFASMELESFASRDKIWFHPTIGLRYETTADQIRFVLAEVERALRSHPKVDPDGARIRFLGFGASSLDFEIFAYVRETDFAAYLLVAQELNLRIMDVVERAGTGFAFPSQTTYLEAGTGVDRERARALADEIAAARDGDERAAPGSGPRADEGKA